MRGAVGNKERWKGRRTPTQDPSTTNPRRRRRYHLGTCAFGAAIIAFVQFLRIVLNYIGPSSTSILGSSQGALPDSNATFCVLDRQRGLTLARPTAAPTATGSAYV